MGVKRKGNPDWEQTTSASGRTTYRKRRTDTPDSAGRSAAPSGDFGEGIAPTAREEIDQLTELIESWVPNPSNWASEALGKVYEKDSGFRVAEEIEKVGGIQSAVVVSDSTGRAYGVLAMESWESTEVLRVVPLKEVTERIPAMSLGQSVDKIADRELADSMVDFVARNTTRVWNPSARVMDMDGTYADVTDDDGRMLFQLGANQEKDPWEFPGELSLGIDLWDNGQVHNGRRWEYGAGYYDPTLGRGVLMIGLGASEYGRSLGMITVTDDGLVVNDPDNLDYGWVDGSDRMYLLTPDGTVKRTRYAED